MRDYTAILQNAVSMAAQINFPVSANPISIF